MRSNGGWEELGETLWHFRPSSLKRFFPRRLWTGKNLFNIWANNLNLRNFFRNLSGNNLPFECTVYPPGIIATAFTVLELWTGGEGGIPLWPQKCEQTIPVSIELKGYNFSLRISIRYKECFQTPLKSLLRTINCKSSTYIKTSVVYTSEYTEYIYRICCSFDSFLCVDPQNFRVSPSQTCLSWHWASDKIDEYLMSQPVDVRLRYSGAERWDEGFRG